MPLPQALLQWKNHQIKKGPCPSRGREEPHHHCSNRKILSAQPINYSTRCKRLFSSYSLLPFLLGRRLFSGSEKIPDGFLGALPYGPLGFSLGSFYFTLLETVGRNFFCFCKWRRETVDIEVTGGALAKLEMVAMLHKPCDADLFEGWGPKEEVLRMDFLGTTKHCPLSKRLIANCC